MTDPINDPVYQATQPKQVYLAEDTEEIVEFLREAVRPRYSLRSISYGHTTVKATLFDLNRGNTFDIEIKVRVGL